MEKISHIVRGSPRVASVDLKSASAVRPGAPSYGRPVGETSGGPASEGTTASRAAALHTQLNEQRRSSQDRVVEQMADQFFMSRIRRPAEAEVTPIQQPAPVETAPAGDTDAVSDKMETREAMAEMQAPEGYTPRGSFVDVRA